MDWSGSSVDNREMFSVLLNRSYTESRPFVLPTPPVSSLGMHKELRGDTARTADPKTGTGQPMQHHVQHRKLKGRRREGQMFGVVVGCLPKSPLCMLEPCFPGDG